uniref:Putative caspase n=1 Tax=Corethrella appendiculata TaxID=1370023 RepID=U5ERQ7_9DIPT
MKSTNTLFFVLTIIIFIMVIIAQAIIIHDKNVIVNDKNLINYNQWERDKVDLNNDTNYLMNHKERGVALIFNHFEYDNEKIPKRHGTQADEENIKSTLLKLGFTENNIHVKNDLTVQEIFDEVDKLKVQQKILENSDCCMVFILTHGGENDVLKAKDKRFKLLDLVENFTPAKMPGLAGKPKIFCIQACRGHAEEHTFSGETFLNRNVESPQCYKYPSHADFLICSSTYPGYVSYRNNHGSRFIRELCNAINQADLSKTDMYSILGAVNKSVANYEKQMPGFYSTLTRPLYFVLK